MLIASKHKRPKAPIDLVTAVYFFTPIDPTNPDSEHVCEVTDTAHIQRLLSITEGYYICTTERVPGRPVPSAPPVPAPAAPPAPPAPPAPAAVVPPAANDSENTGSSGSAPPDPPADTGQPASASAPAPAPAPAPEIQEAATNLLGLKWQKLQAELAKGGIPVEVVQLALATEKGLPADDQRATTIKVLTKHLQAG